jgi:hypothetical protein
VQTHDAANRQGAGAPQRRAAGRRARKRPPLAARLALVPAWPAVAVLAVLFAARPGWRAVAWFGTAVAGAGLVTDGVVVAARPAAAVANTVLYPLGLATWLLLSRWRELPGDLSVDPEPEHRRLAVHGHY